MDNEIIREALKSAGFNQRQVSVKTSSGCCSTVTIHSIDVDYYAVKRVVDPFDTGSTDPYTDYFSGYIVNLQLSHVLEAKIVEEYRHLFTDHPLGVYWEFDGIKLCRLLDGYSVDYVDGSLGGNGYRYSHVHIDLDCIDRLCVVHWKSKNYSISDAKDLEKKDIQERAALEDARLKKADEIHSREERDFAKCVAPTVTEITNNVYIGVGWYIDYGCDSMKLYHRSTVDRVETCKVSRVVEFSDAHSWNFFTNHLLRDYDFIKGVGGYTLRHDDPRLDEFNKMEAEGIEITYGSPEFEYFRTKSVTLVAVCKYEESTIVVDPSGRGYAKYVGVMNLSML